MLKNICSSFIRCDIQKIAKVYFTISSALCRQMRASAVIASQRATEDVTSLCDNAHNFKGFEDLTEPQLKKKIDFLKSYKIQENLISQNPWLLGLSSEKLSLRLHYLKSLQISTDGMVCLLTLSAPRLIKLCRVCKLDIMNYQHHRIHYLSKVLNKEDVVICKALAKYSFLQRISFKHLQDTTGVILQYGMSPDFLLRDCWVLQYKPENVAAQLEKVKKCGINVIKPWMGRCDEEVLNRLLQKVSSKNKLLGENPLSAYLSKRLACTEDEVKTMLEKEPQLQKMNVLKMKEMLDFLFANEFTTNQITSSLHRVVKRRFETLSTRLTEMRQIGCSLKSVYPLSLSEKDYARYIKGKKNRLKKSKKTNNETKSS